MDLDLKKKSRNHKTVGSSCGSSASWPGPSPWGLTDTKTVGSWVLLLQPLGIPHPLWKAGLEWVTSFAFSGVCPGAGHGKWPLASSLPKFLLFSKQWLLLPGLATSSQSLCSWEAATGRGLHGPQNRPSTHACPA
jgi:hypothetical protein